MFYCFCVHLNFILVSGAEVEKVIVRKVGRFEFRRGYFFGHCKNGGPAIHTTAVSIVITLILPYVYNSLILVLNSLINVFEI